MPRGRIVGGERYPVWGGYGVGVAAAGMAWINGRMSGFACLAAIVGLTAVAWAITSFGRWRDTRDAEREAESRRKPRE